MSAAAPATTIDDKPVPAKGKKKKLIVIIAAALLVVLAGGGAGVYVLKKRAAAAAAAEEAESGGAAGDAPKPAEGPRVAPTYVALDPFVVNLADRESERYAQIAVTLEVDDPKFAEEMKLYMPAIRNAVLMILAHKSAADLLDRAGKDALAAEIIREVVRPMGIEAETASAVAAVPAPAEGDGSAKPAAKPAKPAKPAAHNPVRRVLFASFIVQ